MRFLRWCAALLCALLSFICFLIGLLGLVAQSTGGLVYIAVSIALGAACFTLRPPHRVRQMT